MLWVPQKGRIRHEHNWGTVGSANPGTAVTTGASASTKGTPAELIASTSFDAYWIEIFAANYALNGQATDAALDILVGAATEEVLVPNLLAGYAPGITGSSHSQPPKTWAFPLYIPAGTRIAAQAAGNRTSTAMYVGVRLVGGDGYPPWQVGRKVTTYGMGTVPDGTSITAGASGAEGSWTEITAGTSEDHFALFPSFQADSDTALNTRGLMVDIGIGAATEEELAQSYLYTSDDDEFMCGPLPNLPYFDSIPSGSRLTMRASCSGTVNSYTGVIHAVS